MRRALFSLVLLLASCAPRAEGEVWRFAIEESPGSVQDRYAQRFRELVHERTGGAVRVIVYPYGALGTSDQITEQVHAGTLELAMSSPGHLGTLIPEVQAFVLHFLMSADERVNARALADPEVRAALDLLYRDKGLAFLAAFGEGTLAWTTHAPVRRPADLEGMRFRVMTSPLSIATFAEYGASPTPLPYGEVYSALQLRMIDAQENPVFAIEEMSFYEVTDHLIFPRHAEFVTTLAANARWRASLSPARRAMLGDVVRVLQDEILVVQQELHDARLARIRERRPETTVIELSDAERAPFRARAARVREAFVRDVGPRGRALVEALEAAVARARNAR